MLKLLQLPKCHLVLQQTTRKVINSPVKAKQLTVSSTPWYIVTCTLYLATYCNLEQS